MTGSCTPSLERDIWASPEPWSEFVRSTTLSDRLPEASATSTVSTTSTEDPDSCGCQWLMWLGVILVVLLVCLGAGYLCYQLCRPSETQTVAYPMRTVGGGLHFWR